MSKSSLSISAVCEEASVAVVNDELEKLGHGTGTFFVAYVTQDKATNAKPTHRVVDNWQCKPEEWSLIKAVFDRNGVKYAIRSRNDSKMIETNLDSIKSNVGTVMVGKAVAMGSGIKPRVIAYDDPNRNQK